LEVILKYFSDFTPLQLEQFKALDELYKEWNSKINVISRKDIEGLYEKHVLHSLSIAALFDFENGTEIIDIGTGGGFPGIPLAIYFPEVKFHLVDSIAKKLKVVEGIVSVTGLKNITVQHIRAEEIKNTRLNDSVGQGKFDFAVSRAVAPLKDLWRWSKPLLKSRKPGASLSGRQAGQESAQTDNSELPASNSGLICLKGGDLTTEIQESGVRPQLFSIFEIFPEPFYTDKHLVYVPR
jgi:16S rRNA (guanine527-N7)-methyltransferase